MINKMDVHTKNLILAGTSWNVCYATQQISYYYYYYYYYYVKSLTGKLSSKLSITCFEAEWTPCSPSLELSSKCRCDLLISSYEF